LQDGLGALTDIAFSHDLVARVAGLGGDPAMLQKDGAEQAFAAGALVGQAAAPTGKRLKAAVKAHRALRDAKPFW